MTAMPLKALALAIAIGTAAGCAQMGGGTSGTSSGTTGPYGSAPPGSTSGSTDPNLNVACQNVPAIERDACMAREKERRASGVRGS